MSESTSCPYRRGDPDGTQWCALAEQTAETLERTREGLDRILALWWELETIMGRVAASCTDPAALADWEAWKRRRNETPS